MPTNTTNNKRLAKNTLVLYLRMLFTMVLQLYTSRIVLQALGVEDYGIYNVVGGVIAMLNFINMSLSNANSRFLAIEIGTKNGIRLKKLFSCIMTINWLFAIVIFIVAESIGLWFVITQLNIPDTRMTAAIWVYQSATLSSIIMIASAPYNGLIIAHEKMSAFAIVSIIDALCKFLIAIAILYAPIDRLILYAILHVIVQMLVRLIYMIYCKKNFQESKYHFRWDNEISSKILSFAGWTLSGNIAVMGYTQGINILLNIFYGTTVNAARGISVQVQSAARMFFSGFQTAINPQILKSYGQLNLNKMHRLVTISSRCSFFLMLLVAIPICLHTQYILELWLGTVPQYTAEFVQIMIAVGLINTLQNPTMTALHATGKIRNVQIAESCMLLSVVPIAYILLKIFHISPVMVLLVYFFIEFITQFLRVILIYPKIKMPIKDYFTKVLWPIFKVLVVSSIICGFISSKFSFSNFCDFCLLILIYTCITLISIYIFGLFINEKQFINNLILTKIQNIYHKNSNK